MKNTIVPAPVPMLDATEAAIISDFLFDATEMGYISDDTNSAIYQAFQVRCPHKWMTETPRHFCLVCFKAKGQGA